MNHHQILEAMRTRHSVRQYTDRKLSDEKVKTIENLLEELSRTSSISFHLMCNEPKAFGSWKAKYGSFSGVSNYIVISTPDQSARNQELAGYFGQQAVLAVQHMGLNTCWVALTFKKESQLWDLRPGWKVICLIALGYGKNQGVPHRSKPAEKLANLSMDSPEWFKKGIEAAMLAPTAVNQQKFYLEQKGDRAKPTGKGGFYSAIDQGIVRYHFEQGSGKGPSIWA